MKKNHQVHYRTEMKNSIVTLIFIVFFTINSFSQVTTFQIDSLDLIGETHKSIEYAKQYIQEKGENRLVSYNIACRYGKLNVIDSCIIYLRKSIELGYNDVYILADEDLNILHDLKIWSEIKNSIVSNFVSKNKNISDPILAMDIIKLGVKDQNVRAIIIKIVKTD